MTIIEKYLKSFEAYTSGELSTSDKLAFETKLKHNNMLQKAWDEYCSMLEAFSDHEAIRLRIKLNQEFANIHENGKNLYLIRFPWFRISAAAIIVIIMGSLIYFFCSNNLPVQIFVETPINNKIDTTDALNNDVMMIDSLPKTVSDVDLSKEGGAGEIRLASIYDREEYQISPVFAGLLHNVYRSSWFELRAPEDSVLITKGDSLLFTWETNIKDSLYFDILDRNGHVIYKHPEAVINKWIFHPDLDPAIYLYRFATRDEPVWVGVVVRK